MTSCPVCGETLPNHKPYCPSHIQSRIAQNNGHNLIPDKSEKEDTDKVEEPFHIWKIKCPRCKAMPGFPCFTTSHSEKVDYFQVCNARVLAYEAFKLGTVNEMGVAKGQIIKGN